MRSKTGTVISNSSDKTIVVRVDREVRHPIYKKNYRVSKKFHAHDEKNEAAVGDVVEISESKPLSKMKTWKLDKVVSKNAKVVDQPAAVESESEKELKESVAKEKVAPPKVEKSKTAEAQDKEPKSNSEIEKTEK
ncbi:MAG: 30S ribosomal protein S17 [Candidatus Peribacteraceae bacterium]|nr:30S ribosomal protein S17 [Candidatus Peribacteraceae bacterium]